MTTIEKLGYVYIEECVYSSLVCVSNETKLAGFSDTVQTHYCLLGVKQFFGIVFGVHRKPPTPEQCLMKNVLTQIAFAKELQTLNDEKGTQIIWMQMYIKIWLFNIQY